MNSHRTTYQNYFQYCHTTITKYVAASFQVLWPFLLQFIVPPEYTEALPVLCQSLTALGEKFKESGSDSFHIDFDTEVNIPSPHAIFARLLGT